MKRSELTIKIDKFSIPDENQFIKEGYAENKISNEIQMTCIPERNYLIKWTDYDQYTVNMQIGISSLEGTQQRITGNQNTLQK